VVADAVLRARRASASRRVLPDFLLIGAQKAGTTSLYSYLAAHPGVRPAARKEVHYFDVNYARGEDWYRAMFPTERALGGAGAAGRRSITGEASPYYLFHPLAAERAAQLVPDARLIVLLRDPVERAWSHYLHEVAAGRETLSIEDALDAESSRLAGAEDAIRSGQPIEPITRHRNFSYTARGRYADQIRVWRSHFPAEAFVFVDAAVLFAEPNRAWQQVVDFLDLDQAAQPRFDVHNRGSGAPLDPGVHDRLAAEFEAPNRDLEKLLGMTLSWTSRSADQ
jgi:hypothetical protein